VRLNRSWTRESFQYGWIKVNIAKYTKIFISIYISTIYIHKYLILNDIIDYLKKKKKGIFEKNVSTKFV